MMGLHRWVAAAAASLLAAGAAQAVVSVPVNLVQNGGFEAPDIGNPSAGYWYTSAISNWTTVGHDTVLFNSSYRPVSAGGTQAVQIEQSGDQLLQSFATVVGQQYLLTFDLSTWWTDDLSKVSSLQVSVGPASATFTATGTSYSAKSLLFTADNAMTTLTFTNVGATNVSYPQLDNVSVTAVPEPETAAMMLVGLGVVGFAAARRGAGRRDSCA